MARLEELREELFERYRALAVGIGMKLAQSRRVRIERSYGGWEDIESAALIGLWNAIRRFDPKREIEKPGSFKNYLYIWVLKEVNEEIERITSNPRKRSGGVLEKDYEDKVPIDSVDLPCDGLNGVEFEAHLEKLGLKEAWLLISGGCELQEVSEILGVPYPELWSGFSGALAEWLN